MANRKISDFTALTQPAPADVLPIVDVSEALDADKNKKITVEEIFKSIPSGSAASPGIAFEGDDGNGIYFVSPDTIGISTNGTSRITVGSGGTVAVAGGLTAGGNAVVTVGDTGTVTSAMIASGTIVDADINASAEIAVSKLADGTARQLLQTDAAGTGVEWTSNVDIPGTLDVTGATVLDSTLSVPLGSAASPTIFFTGDSNTGIYSPGADQVAISTNGTGRLFIGSTGTVNFTGAGTAGSTQAVSFNGSAPVNSLVIDSSGRVGLGTSSPGARLHVTGGDSVFGASNLTRILNANQIIDFTNAAQDTYVAGRINGLNLKFYTNTGSGIDIDSSGCVGIGTSTPGAEIPEDNSGNQLTGAILDVNGHLLFSSAAPYIKPNTKAESGRPLYIQAGDTRQTNYNGGSLYLEAGGQDPSWGGTANGGNVFIDGGQKGGVGTDGNVILASNRGRVGIGTTSPLYPLHVEKNQEDILALVNTGIITYRFQVKTDASLAIVQNATERARIDSSGRLLVGTIASPAYQLQVSTDSAGKPSTNTWTIVSDERIKEDIELADLDICYDAIKNIPLKRFKWKDEVYTEEQVPDRHKLGWIAQDVESVFPKAVRVHEFKYNQVFEETVIPAVEEELDEDGNVVTPAQPERIEKGELISEEVIEDCRDLNADQLYAAMYGAIQKLIQKVETLEAEIQELKA